MGVNTSNYYSCSSVLEKTNCIPTVDAQSVASEMIMIFLVQKPQPQPCCARKADLLLLLACRFRPRDGAAAETLNSVPPSHHRRGKGSGPPGADDDELSSSIRSQI